MVSPSVQPPTMQGHMHPHSGGLWLDCLHRSVLQLGDPGVLFSSGAEEILGPAALKSTSDACMQASVAAASLQEGIYQRAYILSTGASAFHVELNIPVLLHCHR